MRALALVHIRLAQRPPRLVRGGVPLAERGEQRLRLRGGKAVQQRQVAAHIQQRLMLVLAVDVHELIAHLLERRGGDERAVDAAYAAARAEQLAREDDLAVLRRKRELLEHAVHGRVRLERERGLHGRLLRAGADELAAGALAKHEIERLDDDGFARARLAREDGEPILERDRQPVDQRDIPDPERP